LDKLDTRYWMLVKSRIKNQESRIKNQESRIPRSGQTTNPKQQTREAELERAFFLTAEK